jgi:hypothetical protein
MHNVNPGQVLELQLPAARAANRLPHRGRPCDQLDRWPVSPASSDRLRAAARELGLAVGTAGCLLAERGLLLQELGSKDAALADVLDARAKRTTVRRPLSYASAVYLRSLSVSVEPTDGRDDRMIRLPRRLTDRLATAGGPELLLAGDIDQARRWERAAVAEDLTMTEWAEAALLDDSPRSA